MAKLRQNVRENGKVAPECSPHDQVALECSSQIQVAPEGSPNLEVALECSRKWPGCARMFEKTVRLR